MEPEKAPGFEKRNPKNPNPSLSGIKGSNPILQISQDSPGFLGEDHLNQISSFWGQKAVDFPGVGVRFFPWQFVPRFLPDGCFFFLAWYHELPNRGGGKVPWISGS